MKTTAMAIALAITLIPAVSLADSDDTEGVIKSVDANHATITLEDGKVYTAPSEFNFDGLEPGVKVVIYYTASGGKRVIDDLQVE